MEPLQINISMDSQLDRPGVIRLRDEVLIFEFNHFIIPAAPFEFEYISVSLVDRGTADFEVDGQTFHLEPNDQMIVRPHQVIRMVNISPDYHSHTMLFSRTFMDYLAIEDAYSFFLSVSKTPKVTLQGEEIDAIRDCCRMITAILNHPENPYRKEMLYHLIKAYVYGFAYYKKPKEEIPAGREEEVTTRFAQQLDLHFREEHSVAYYAKQLNLSPKYMSACIKKISGKSAIQCIEDKLMQKAATMLQQSRMSISEIGYQLGFESVSAFGKYFRNYYQMGPREWRAQMQSSSRTTQQNEK